MRTRKAIAATLCALVIGIMPVLAGCAGGRIIEHVVTGSGKLVTNTMNFSGFNQVEVSSAFEADVSRADAFSVTVTTDDNLVQYVEVTKPGSTLVVRLKPGIAFIHSTQRVQITMPDMRSVTISGASRVRSMGSIPQTQSKSAHPEPAQWSWRT